MAKDHKNYNSDGKSSEDRALDRFTDMLIEKIQKLQGGWKKPWCSAKRAERRKTLGVDACKGTNRRH